MKLDEMKVVVTEHCKERIKERGISLEKIMYSFRDKVKNLRYYNNFDKDLCYRDNECSVFFTIEDKTIVLISVIDEYADIFKETVVI
ncbi:MAG: hypothetical protein ACQEQF_07100 [Bacillota bacterium]